MPWNEAVTTTTQGGDGVEREVKMHDNLKALELLNRRLWLFTDKVKHFGSVDTGTK